MYFLKVGSLPHSHVFSHSKTALYNNTFQAQTKLHLLSWAWEINPILQYIAYHYNAILFWLLVDVAYQAWYNSYISSLQSLVKAIILFKVEGYVELFW